MNESIIQTFINAENKSFFCVENDGMRGYFLRQTG